MKRILLITSVLPWPLRRNGGAQRSALVKKALEKWGTVDVFAVGGPELRENDPSFDQKLAEQNVVACIVRTPREPQLPFYAVGPAKNLFKTIYSYESNYQPDAVAADRLGSLIGGKKYDLIVSRYLQPALQAGVGRYKDIPKFLDFDDIDWSTLAANLEAKPWPGIGGKIGSKEVFKRIKAACDHSMSLFNQVFVTSEEDRAILNHPAHLLPNIPFSDRADASIDPLPPLPESRELLFVGDLQFPPNRDGLNHFLTNVWPKVRDKIPDAVLSIVGRGLTEERAVEWRRIGGVNVIGFAPDLVDCYRRCAMTVVPIYTGGGTKIKILESLAFGRTVVTTQHAMRGYAGLASDHPAVAVAESDPDFADACIGLLTNPGLRDAMAERGRAIVNEQFSFAGFSSVIDNAVSEVLK